MELKLRMLSLSIEYLKDSLAFLISFKSLTDDVVVDCSQKLDRLLSQYDECIKNNGGAA